MKTAWHKIYNHPLKANHKFPMIKYDLLKDELIKRQIIFENDIITPFPISDNDVLLAHNQDYYNKLNSLALSSIEERRTGFPQSERLIERERCIMQGTYLAAMEAIKDGFTFNIAGGTHHAFSYKGEGFCLLNDMALSALMLLKYNRISRILILDLDVHQGNGTAEILQNNKNIFTFSMHGKDNYPIEKEVSDLDIELNHSVLDEEYLDILYTSLHKIFKTFSPQFILYQAGVDILESDKFGRLNITFEGCKQRDEIVYEFASKNSIPVTATMGGGYSEDINIIVEAHLNTFLSAKRNL
jgi:acetoin utilization deacetylase AcuC-like enzyme